MTDNYPIAAEAVKRGWKVFPCGSDKKPLCKWKEAATHDTQKIFDFWEAHPEALVGIPCNLNDIWALDLDAKNGADGIANFQKLAKKHGAESVQVGPMQSTPNGGLHLIFSLPGNMDIPQSAGKIAPGIDVRSAGYICTGSLPDGRAYLWNSAEGHGMDAPIKDAPNWLLDLLAVKVEATQAEAPRPAPTRGDLDKIYRKCFSRARPGNRNHSGFDLACQCRDAGISEAETLTLPYPEEAPAGDHLYTREEWTLSVKSAYSGITRPPARSPNEPPDGEMTGDNPKEPEAPPIDLEAPGETQQAKPVTDDWVDPWRDAWHTLADAFTPRPPAEYAVENLIKLPSLIAWYGNPGDLKTFLLQYIFLCIAAGKPCFPEAPWKSGGRVFAVTPYPVIWLDFDNGSDLTKERFEALARAMSIDPNLPNLHYVSMPSPWLILGDPKSVGHLIHQIQQFGARAVGIDNLGTTKGAAKENTDDMIPVMSNLRQVVEATRAGLSIVHHETKSGALTARRGDSLRGHSSIEAAVDLALLIERELGSDIVTIQSTKTRGTPVDPFSAAFTYTHKTETLELETAMFFALPCENKRSPKAIEAAIKESLVNGPMLKTALAKQVQTATEGIGINRIRDYIDRMITAETITTTPGGKTTGQLCTLR